MDTKWRWFQLLPRWTQGEFLVLASDKEWDKHKKEALDSSPLRENVKAVKTKADEWRKLAEPEMKKSRETAEKQQSKANKWHKAVRLAVLDD